MENMEIFLSSNQPTTFPRYGNRTEVVNDLKTSQKHKCLSEDCNFQFVIEFDNEDEI